LTDFQNFFILELNSDCVMNWSLKITELYVGTGSTRTSHIYGKVDASGRPYCLGICL